MLRLQRQAGNRAVGAVLRRSQPALPTLMRAPVAADVVTRTRDLERELERISTAAQNGVERLGGASDTALEDLTAANTHLQTSSKNYKSGYGLFDTVLKRADKEYEFDKNVEDTVQSIFVAAALAVVAPEAILTVGLLRAAASSTSSRLTVLGLRGLVSREATLSGVRAVEGAVGEGFEAVGGAAVGTVVTADTKPSDSAAGAGETPGERFEAALTRLGTLITTVPHVGKLVAAQSGVVAGAGTLAREAVKLRNGEAARWTVEEIESKTVALREEVDATAKLIQTAEGLGARLRVMRQQVTAKAIEEPVAIENRLWLAWMASLEGSAHNMLDNDVLEEYLGPEGKGLMADFGTYTTDAETADAAAQARRQWLTENGITPGTYPDTQYRVEMKLRQMRRDLTGRPGKITDTRRVVIDGTSYRYAGNAGDLASGTAVVVLHVVAPPELANGTSLLAKVYDNQLEVYCNVDTARATVRVPHVVGLAREEAVRRIEERHLVPEVRYQAQPDVAPGSALGISPVPETEVGWGSTVVLTLAT